MKKLLMLVAGLAVVDFAAAAPLFHAQGEFAGEVTAHSVLLQTRVTATAGLDPAGDVPGAPGWVRFEYADSPEFESSQFTGWRQAEAGQDFIVRAELTGLKAGTSYHYRVQLRPTSEGAVAAGPARHFKTLPGGAAVAEVRFCMGSCMNYHSFMVGRANGGGPVTATAEDRRLGYPVFATMNRLRPDFFIGTGDIVYYDHPRQTAAKTVPELRRKWHEQFRLPRLVEFFGRTPAYWSKDDHDYRYNDADREGTRQPDHETGIRIFREQMPILPADDRRSPTYRTHRMSRDLQLWFVEGRDYRSQNKSPDGPDKSIWGEAQNEWLRRTLKASDATWKIIINPTPIVGPDDAYKKDNHTNPGGFRHEAEQFFAWLQQEKIGNVYNFCGDRHWQFHSIHPNGIEEFGCGALNDENSRRGVKPGSKRGSDPEAKIRQPYTYPEPTGGFLHVTSKRGAQGRPELIIEFRDDEGTVLHTVTKRADK
jgi:alkaline phosphatase D